MLLYNAHCKVTTGEIENNPYGRYLCGRTYPESVLELITANISVGIMVAAKNGKG
jgi:Tfp pilus assembly protein PilF